MLVFCRSRKFPAAETNSPVREIPPLRFFSSLYFLLTSLPQAAALQPSYNLQKIGSLHEKLKERGGKGTARVSPTPWKCDLLYQHQKDLLYWLSEVLHLEKLILFKSQRQEGRSFSYKLNIRIAFPQFHSQPSVFLGSINQSRSSVRA